MSGLRQVLKGVFAQGAIDKAKIVKAGRDGEGCCIFCCNFCSPSEIKVRSLLLLLAAFAFFAVAGGVLPVKAQTVVNTPRPLPTATPVYPPAQSPVYSTLPPAPIQQQQSNFSPATSFTPSNNYLRNSAAFRQEIMRMEITVVRENQSLPITQVPRVQKGDVIKMRLLDEAVGGIKPDQSLWDWTFLAAYINPNRRTDDAGKNKKESAVSEEIQFRKRGWYKEYSFVVPYDSQPVFFLYPKPKYRSKILKVVSRNYNEVRKLGEKTIEIAGAYAQISSFLNELQFVLYQTQASRYANNNGYGNASNLYSSANPYNSYNPLNPPRPGQQRPDVPFNYNAFIEQTIERLARSFNIQMPQCWQSGGSGYGGYGSGYGSSGSLYGSYGSSGGYGASNQNNFGYAVSQELIGRAQCVAKNIRLEDFDASVASMLQQGGIMVAAQLRNKYPQLAYWINLAAAAIDFIVKAFQKSPLRIMPTIVQTSDGSGGGGYGGSNPYGNNQPSYAAQSGYLPNPNASGSPGGRTTTPVSPNSPPVKISLYAENQPDANQFVTAYPIVVHKWQAEPDPEVISIPPPVLAEPCLHTGMNLLKNTGIGEEPEADAFTKDFRLIMSSTNGFKKEFPLKKNLGLGGWELNLTREDINSFPKVEMTIESFIAGTRGFNEIKSPAFSLPLALGGTYEITRQSQKAFAVGAQRTVTLRNALGGCQCLQAVVYKPSFGGQFVFEANSKDGNNRLQISADGREASFKIDAGSFQPGAGQLELKSYGGETTNLNLKLYPLPPNVAGVKMARGDNQAIITGERLEQLQSVKINGKRAGVVGNDRAIRNNPGNSQAAQGGNLNQGGNPYANNQLGQSSYLNPNPNQSPTQNRLPPPNSSPVPGAAPIRVQSGGSLPNQNQGIVQNQPTNQPTNQPINQMNSYSDNPLSPNERLIVFDNPYDRLTDNVISLELVLEDDRSAPVAQTFPAAPSRPAIAVNEQKEIEARAVDSQINSGTGNTAQRAATGTAFSSTFNSPPLNSLVFPVDTAEVSIKAQNALTDYEFKVENIQIETRIEKSQNNPGAGTELPKASFEVLDWMYLKISFQLSEQAQTLLGGRRLQFRIRDRDRGDSDWYSIKQTFVRIPEITAVKCADEMNGMCEMTGTGIDYIAQVSTDGGKSWYPENAASLQTQQSADGKTVASIPLYANKKLLQIRLRDYPRTEGLPVSDYAFSNSVKGTKKNVQPDKANSNSAQPNLPNGNRVSNPNQPRNEKPAERNRPAAANPNRQPPGTNRPAPGIPESTKRANQKPD